MAIPIPFIDAIVKAVPALAPVLQSAVQGLTDPKFIDAIGRNSPVTKVLDSGHELAKGLLGLDVDISTEVEDMTNFGNDTNALLNNMLKLSASKSITTIPALKRATNQQLREAKIDFIPRPEVLLNFEEAESGAKVADLASLYFDWGRDVRIPLSLQSPKPINKAILKVCIKTLNGSEILLKKKWRLKDGVAERLDDTLHLSRGELTVLKPNEEYSMDIRLIWPNRSGQRLGTSLHRVVKFVKGYLYDRGGDPVGENVPLNDLKKYRAFWHKAWGAGLEENFRDIDLDAKYYVTLNKGMGANSRMESLTRFEAGGGNSQKGRLKSGMGYGLEALNELLPAISEQVSLSQEELQALDNSGFAHRFTQVGRHKLNFWGLEGESVALWVYPELQMHQVYLQKAAEVNDNGLVTAMESHSLQFPLPVSVHFIGTQM